MRPLRRNPDGTGLAGRSAVSRRSPMGPTIGFASLRASHPGKPPSRRRGTRSEVPWMILLYLAVAAAYLSAAWLEWQALAGPAHARSARRAGVSLWLPAAALAGPAALIARS